MRRINKVVVGVLFFIGLVCPPKAEAFIVINEFLADPAADLSGDSNNDGTRNGSEDVVALLPQWNAGSRWIAI